jgi:hypothetical protein
LQCSWQACFSLYMYRLMNQTLITKVTARNTNISIMTFP